MSKTESNSMIKFPFIDAKKSKEIACVRSDPEDNGDDDSAANDNKRKDPIPAHFPTSKRSSVPTSAPKPTSQAKTVAAAAAGKKKAQAPEPKKTRQQQQDTGKVDEVPDEYADEDFADEVVEEVMNS